MKFPITCWKSHRDGFTLGEEPKTIHTMHECTTRARLFPRCPFNLKGVLLLAALQTGSFCDLDPAPELLGNTRINNNLTILSTSSCSLELFFFLLFFYIMHEETRFHSSWVTPEKILLPGQTKRNIKVNPPVSALLSPRSDGTCDCWLQPQVVSLDMIDCQCGGKTFASFKVGYIINIKYNINEIILHEEVEPWLPCPPHPFYLAAFPGTDNCSSLSHLPSSLPY